MKVKSESEVAQSCLTLWDPMDCSPPGSSIHGIFQARVLEWAAIAFSDRCDRWTIKKAAYWRIDACEFWCWRKLLRVPWTTRRSNQSILKEINTEYSLERLMLKLKLQCFWPPDGKSRLIGKGPDAGKDWTQKEKRAAEDEMVRQHHPLNGHEFEQTPGNSENGETWHAAVHEVTKNQTQLSDWTTTI